MSSTAAQGVAPKTTGEEKAREFARWAKSHRDTPPISGDAIIRATMNPDRWSMPTLIDTNILPRSVQPSLPRMPWRSPLWKTS